MLPLESLLPTFSQICTVYTVMASRTASYAATILAETAGSESPSLTRESLSGVHDDISLSMPLQPPPNIPPGFLHSSVSPHHPHPFVATQVLHESATPQGSGAAPAFAGLQTNRSAKKRRAMKRAMACVVWSGGSTPTRVSLERSKPSNVTEKRLANFLGYAHRHSVSPKTKQTEEAGSRFSENHQPLAAWWPNSNSHLAESKESVAAFPLRAAMADQEAHEAALEEKGECTHLPRVVSARSAVFGRTDRRRRASHRAFSGH